MKYFELEPWEKEISDAIENGEFVDAPDTEKEKEYLHSLASSMLKKTKKHQYPHFRARSSQSEIEST